MEKKKLTIDELITISDRLGIDLNELLTLSNHETKTQIKIIREEITEILKTPPGVRKNKRIFEIYSHLKKNKKVNLEWFNLYLFFTLGFSRDSKKISIPSIEDLEYLKSKYEGKSFFTFIDYKIYLNILPIFGFDSCQFLEKLLFPVEFKERRNIEFISTVFLAYNNMISICIDDFNYSKGFGYLKDALKFENREIDSYSKIQFLYLEQILFYQQFKDQNNPKKALESLMEAYKFADFVENLGDTRQSKIMYEELDRITNTDNVESLKKSYGLITQKPLTQIQEIKMILNGTPPNKID